MKVFLQSIIAQLLLTPYIAYRGQQALPNKWSRFTFILLCAIELIIYFIGYIFRNHLSDELLVSIQMVCNTWYFSCIYIMMPLVIIEVIRWSNKRRPWLPTYIITHYKTTKAILFTTIAIAVSSLMVHAYNNVANPIVKHVYINIPKDGGTLDSLTIAMMSDTHFGEVITRKYAEKYVALCNAEKPDLIVFVGDIIDYEVLYAEKGKVEEVLQQLKAPMGVYAVNGNHEYRANREAKRRWIEKAGLTLLSDSVVSLADSSFYLIGRDDLVNYMRAPLQELMQPLDQTKPSIIIEHQPESLAETAMNKADLALHGHTHGGQLWPYTIVINQVFECAYGSYRKGDSQYYVSCGIGSAGPPYRIATRSELVMLHITFDKTKEETK
jgi:hypothetical protein